MYAYELCNVGMILKLKKVVNSCVDKAYRLFSKHFTVEIVKNVLVVTK